MELGKDTNVTFSLGTLISIIVTVAMGVLLYTQMASTTYVDAEIARVEAKQDVQTERDQKLDTAIQLLQQSSANADKNMEAFTRALEQLREDDGD